MYPSLAPKLCFLLICLSYSEGLAQQCAARLYAASHAPVPPALWLKRSKNVPKANQAEFDRKKSELERLAQIAVHDPTEATVQAKQFEIDFPAKFNFTADVEFRARDLAKIKSNTDLQVALDQKFKKQNFNYYDISKVSIVVPNAIHVRLQSGRKRPLNLENPWERKIALFHAQLYFEEMGHALQCVYAKRGHYVTLNDSKIFDDYQEWLERESESDLVNRHLQPFIRDRAISMALEVTHKLSEFGLTVPANLIGTAVLLEAKQHLFQYIQADMLELDIMLWMQRNQLPFNEYQIQSHPLVRPLFREYLQSLTFLEKAGE